MLNPDQVPSEFGGPKMKALRTDLQRRFAFLMGCGASSAAEAVRDAGYSDNDGASTARVTAWRLMATPGIPEAIEEVARSVLLGLAPIAMRKARDILDNPKHPAHARMIETVLDRTGFFGKSEHKVTVEHTVDVRELEQLAARLARENGIAVERFIGTVVEGEVIDVP